MLVVDENKSIVMAPPVPDNSVPSSPIMIKQKRKLDFLQKQAIGELATGLKTHSWAWGYLENLTIVCYKLPSEQQKGEIPNVSAKREG